MYILTSLSIGLWLYCCIFIKCCLTSNILLISTIPSRSHSIWNQKLAKLLADRNHHVTVLDIGSSIFNHKNIKHVELGIMFNGTEVDLNYFSTKSCPVFVTDKLFEWMQKSCEELLKLPRTKLFLEKNMGKKPFDLIIMDGALCESFLGFMDIFGSPPLIEATAYGGSVYLMEYAGNYDNPAYVPYTGSYFTSKMSFVERVQNTMLYIYYYFRYYVKHMYGQNEMARNFFGDNVSNVKDLSRKAIVSLINIHPAIDGVKPLLPSIIPIGGFHVEPGQPLEKDLQTFLDSSKNGAIYFSFGTVLKCESMDEKKFKLFVETFKKINHNVLWKCGKEIPDLPENIRLAKWFRQNDVLAHPNVKVFISHGGLLGTQEAIYHGVPILVLPFVFDQHFIARRLQKMGVAITLTYAELSADLLISTINRLFNDQSFQDKMKERSVAFRDNPISPRDLAVFWIEYVLRHPRTDLLRSETQNMSIYQILLLDVIGFFILIIIVIILVFILVIKFLLMYKKGRKCKVKSS